MEGKNSFVLYTNLIHTVEKLDDPRGGQLFKLILRYVNDKNPKAQSKLLDLVFEPVKQQLKDDLRRWEQKCKNSSEAGKASAAARAKKKAEAATKRAKKEPFNGR